MDTRDTTADPPVHGRPTSGVSRFLFEAPPETPIDELADAYARWEATDDAGQAALSDTRWSE
jgi:hypothetical protein